MADFGTIDVDVEPTHHGIIDIDVPPAPKAAPTDHGVVDIDVAPAPKAPAPKAATYAAGRDWSDPWAATKATQRELFLAKGRERIAQEKARAPVTARFPGGLSVDLPRTPETEKLERPAPEPQPEQESLGRRLFRVPAGVARTIGGAFMEPVETAKGAWEGLVSTGENLGSRVFENLNRLTDAQKAEQDEYIQRRAKADNPADIEREYTQKTGYHLPPVERSWAVGKGAYAPAQKWKERERSEPERQEFYREHGVEAEAPSMGFVESVGHTTRGLLEPFAQFADVAASDRSQREKAKAFTEAAVQLHPATGMPLYAVERASEFAASPGRALTANPAQTLLDIAAARGAVRSRNEAALRKAQGALDARAAAERQPHLEDVAGFERMAQESTQEAAKARAAGDAQAADFHTREAERRQGLADESRAKADAVVSEQAVRTERQFQPDVERETQNAEQERAAREEVKQQEATLAESRARREAAVQARIAAVEADNTLEMQQKKRKIAAIKMRSKMPTPIERVRPELRSKFAKTQRAEARVAETLGALDQPGGVLPEVPLLDTELQTAKQRPNWSDIAVLDSQLAQSMAAMQAPTEALVGKKAKRLPQSISKRTAALAKLREAAETKIKAASDKVQKPLDAFNSAVAEEEAAINQRISATSPAQQVRPEFQKSWAKLQKQNKPKTPERRQKLLEKSLAIDERKLRKIEGQRAKLENKAAPVLQKAEAWRAKSKAFSSALEQTRERSRAVLAEQQKRLADAQKLQLVQSRRIDAATGRAIGPEIRASERAVTGGKKLSVGTTLATRINAERLAAAQRRLEQVQASGAEIRRNRPYQDVTVYHPDFATRGKVGAAIEKGLTYLSPIDLALKAIEKAASLHPVSDVLFNPRSVESRRPLREAETAAKTESEQSRQRLTDVAATLPEQYRPETYETQRRSTEADANLTPEQKQQTLKAIDQDEKYYQRDLSDLWEAAHELTNEQFLEMNPDAPKGEFFSTQVETPEVGELMRRLNEFDRQSDLWREARRTSAASQASGGFGGIVQPNVEANIAARNEAIRLAQAPEGTPGKGRAEAQLRRTIPTAYDAKGNPITPEEFYQGKTRERLPAAPNLWQPNVYPEEAYLEGVYNRAVEKGLGPEDTKYLGEEFPPNQPLTPAQALQFIQDKHGRRITDITPGAFQYREVPSHLGIGGKGGPSSESTGAVEGRGLAKRTMRQVSREDREAYGMSTDPRDAIAALHQENVDTADRNMWRRLSSDSNIYRTIQPNDRNNWVIFDNRKGEFGHPYGSELPEKFWVRADIAADMDLIRKVHELQAASLVQGRGNRIWGATLDLLRGFKAAHTFLSPAGYGTNLFGNLVPQATVAGINPLNPRFMGKVIKAFLEATEGRETESQRQFTLDREATSLGFINRAETNPESIRTLGEGTQGLKARLQGVPQGFKDIVAGLRTKQEGAPELQGTSWEKTRKGTTEQARTIGRMRQAFESVEQAPRKAYSAMDEIPRQAIYEYLKDVKKLEGKEAARIADAAVGQTTDLPGLLRYLSVFIPFTFSFPAAQFQAALGFMRKNPERFLLWSKVNQDLKMDATHKAEQDELMKELGRVDKDFRSMGAGLTREEQRRGQRDQPFTPMATLMPETFRGSTAAVDIGKWQPGDTYAPRGPSDTYADVAQRIISRNPFVDTAAKLIYGKDLARPYNKETMSPEHRIKAIGDSFIPMYQTIARIVASAKGEPFRGVEEAAPLGQTLLRTIGASVQEGEAPEKLKERANMTANVAVRQFRRDFANLNRMAMTRPRSDKVGDTFYSLRNKLEDARANASLEAGRTIDSFLRMLDNAEKRWRSRLDADNRPVAE